ncbi:hypothetical protein B9Z19DRAFT_1091500 [Tuber borchii]|uniref:Uncharacterized protein n=1 Tax=Tuber borchii TaxID=42251 RepID=A0A2T6ZHK7_TUBBO|nr:hypothetical protein B9Z19DRAFT_1091500 [Tuber borchii]
MPTFDYASTDVIRYLSDGTRTDIIHYIIVTGLENLRISASDFPIRIAGANIPNSEISSLVNLASGLASGELRANSVEETGPGLHDQVDSREGNVGNEHNLSFRWYFLSKVPAKKYLYWSGLPATRYIPKSCLVFLHQAEPTTYQFNWGAIARDSVVYLCHGDGEVESLAPGDPTVTGLTFTNLGEPLDDVTGLDNPGLVTVSPGCYQADLFIDRLMDMNGFESEDGFDISGDEAIPLLLEMASVSKDNISFCENDSLAFHQDSNLDGSQQTIRAMSNTRAHDALDDKSVTGTGGLRTADLSNGKAINSCADFNKTSNYQGTHIGGAGVSVLTNSFAALHDFNINPFAQAEEVMPLYPSVFSPGEQISTFNEGDRGEVCVGSLNTGYSAQVAGWPDIPQGTYDPRAPPFTSLGPKRGGRQSRPKSKHPNPKDALKWPPREKIIGFVPTDGGFCFSDLELFLGRVGGVRNWGAFPPVQVAGEYLPKELKYLDWVGREWDKVGKQNEEGKQDKDGKQDPTLQGSSPPIDERTHTGGNSDSNTGP